MSAEKRCAHCGNTLDAKFAFCPFCGRTLETEPTFAPAPERKTSPRVAETLDAFEKQFEALKQQRASARPRRQWNVGGWYYIALVIITCAVLAGFFLFYRSVMQQLMTPKT